MNSTKSLQMLVLDKSVKKNIPFQDRGRLFDLAQEREKKRPNAAEGRGSEGNPASRKIAIDVWGPILPSTIAFSPLFGSQNT